jgi:molecular chaperone DnaJ
VTAVKSDYYELLGIRRDADRETIRRAFHAAARDCHPDVSSSPDAEQRFRALSEAYGVLSKPGARLLYDRYGYRGRGNSGFDEALWEARERAPRGGSVHRELVLHAAEAAAGGTRAVSFESAKACPACQGRGSAGRPDCPDCGSTGRRTQVIHREAGRFLQIEVCPTCNGEVCSECDGAGHRQIQRRLRVRIPPGVEDGEQLRVGGEGDAPSLDGIPGDLLLDVRVLPEPHDSRLIRYLALALFLTALVLLIAYLV